MGKKHRTSEADMQAISRALYIDWMQRNAPVFERSNYLPSGPSGECWTNAWSTGDIYAEGIVTMPDGSLLPHAFNIDERGCAVEVTEGLAGATNYRGIIINRALAADISKDWTGWRSSMFEAGIGAGLSPDGVNLMLSIDAARRMAV